MIARTEKEFDLFQKMDVQRRESETQSRLIQETELPDFLMRDDEEVRSSSTFFHNFCFRSILKYCIVCL